MRICICSSIGLKKTQELKFKEYILLLTFAVVPERGYVHVGKCVHG